MSNFVGRLVQRVMAPETLLQPRMPSLFEDGPSAPFAEMTVEAIAPQPALPAGGRTSGAPASPITPAEPREAVARLRGSAVTRPHPPTEKLRNREIAKPTEATEVHEHVVVNEAAGDVHVRETRETRIEKQHTRTIVPRVIAAAAPLLATPAPDRIESVQGERDVHITIGRIDVRAVTQPPTPRPREKKTPRTLTLDEYLDQRSRR